MSAGKSLKMRNSRAHKSVYINTFAIDKELCQCKRRSQRWDIFQCDSSEIGIVIVGFLVAPALETQRFTRTNIPVCFCRVVWMLWCGRLCLFEVNWTFCLCQCGFLGLFHVTKKRTWGVRSHFKRRGCRKWKRCHSAFGTPELARQASGVLGAGLSKERMMLPNTTERSFFTGSTPPLVFYSCCLKITVASICFYIVRTYLIKGTFSGKLSAWERLRYYLMRWSFKEWLALQFCIWSSIVSKLHSWNGMAFLGWIFNNSLCHWNKISRLPWGPVKDFSRCHHSLCPSKVCSMRMKLMNTVYIRYQLWAPLVL